MESYRLVIEIHIGDKPRLVELSEQDVFVGLLEHQKHDSNIRNLMFLMAMFGIRKTHTTRCIVKLSFSYTKHLEGIKEQCKQCCHTKWLI